MNDCVYDSFATNIGPPVALPVAAEGEMLIVPYVVAARATVEVRMRISNQRVRGGKGNTCT